MIEEKAFREYMIGLALGGGAGFLLHKNLKLSKGLSIGLGCVVGLVISYQLQKKQKAKQILIYRNEEKPYMPQVGQGTPEEQKAFHDSLIKSMPDNFTLKLSADSNVNYYRNSNNEFYKQPYSTTGESGVQPIKISLAEYSDAYVKFKNK